MKKIYLVAIALVCTISGAMAQVTSQPYRFENLKRDQMKPVQQLPEESAKALGVEVYSNDFDNPGDWTIDNDGQTGAEFGWTIDGNSDGWWSGTGINSTSGGNFAELSNGDPTATPATQVLDVIYTLTLNAGLDIPNLPGNTGNTDQVTLQYEQYGALFNDEQLVQISTNGAAGPWVTIRDNRDYHSVLSQSGGAAYPNPETVTINLAPYISGNASNVSLRFQWTTAFPASASNPNVWVTYGWYIDDVKIITNPDNDLEAFNAYWGTVGLNYHQIPLTQTAPIDFTTNAYNNGINSQTGAQLEVDITGAATFNGTSNATTIGPLSYDSLVMNSPYTPSTLGTYNVTWGVTQNEVDDVPSNNDNADISFAVTDFIYARDNGNFDGTFSNSGQEYKLGNLYDIWADQTAYSIDLRLANTTNVGAEFQAKIYRLPSNAATFDDIIQEAETDFVVVTAGHLNTILSLPLIIPADLEADSTYFVAIETAGDAGATADINVSTAGTADEQTCFLYDGPDDTWYYTTNTPVIRINFEDITGINENGNIANVNVYPNPSIDKVTVSYALNNASDIAINVVDVTGKVVYTEASAAKSSGSHELAINTSAFASGVYAIQINTNAGTVTSKFIKK